MYRRGDVVIVSFPFTDGRGDKARPAVIVSGARYHATRRDLILVPVTSRPPHDALDYSVADWREAGLLKPSSVCAKPFTFHHTKILHRAGHLHSADLARLDDMLREALYLGMAS